ncbi:variable surface family protein [Brachyspira pilosicoli]|uniref:variable surface family protein n=1 Tax=Brachyspira pilosicoli TaxID=52584 RepID=UPI000E177AF5|nr:variable surface family protein [Brachyspira pilosicoli]SUW09246.1 variable surface protein VspD [Brachyspira pilosicoli]
MKKVLLTAIALLTIASTSVFGYYGANSDWIDFLVDANQLRFRVRQMGFVLGNDMIRGVVGVRDESETQFGAIFNPDTYTPNGSATKQFLNFIPTVSAGIGYTSDIFSIGVGYNYRYHHSTLRGVTKNGYGLSEHTPVLTMTAMNDSLRIAIPIQVAVKNGDIANYSDGYKYLGVSMDPQIRYYTGIEAFNEIRLYVKYGINQTETTEVANSKQKAESFGFDFRAYFGATVGDVALKPFLKVTYDTALGAKGKVAYKVADINGAVDGSYSDTYGVKSSSGVIFVDAVTGGYEHNPWALNILPTLGMSANSDIVSIYVEAGLGYGAVDTGYKFNSANAANTGILHSMRWNAYGEIYINPVKDLQWYFEAEIGNGGDAFAKNTLQFNGATGITWYLPTL